MLSLARVKHAVSLPRCIQTISDQHARARVQRAQCRHARAASTCEHTRARAAYTHASNARAKTPHWMHAIVHVHPRTLQTLAIRLALGVSLLRQLSWTEDTRNGTRATVGGGHWVSHGPHCECSSNYSPSFRPSGGGGGIPWHTAARDSHIAVARLCAIAIAHSQVIACAPSGNRRPGTQRAQVYPTANLPTHPCKIRACTHTHHLRAGQAHVYA